MMNEIEICNDLLRYIKENPNAYEILMRYFNNYKDEKHETFMDNVPGIILNMTFKYYKERNIATKEMDINAELANCFKQVLGYEFEEWKRM